MNENLLPKLNKINEKIFRLSGHMGTKTPIGGKVLQAFKKKNESVGNIKDLNAGWVKFSKKEAPKLILDILKKNIKEFDSVVIGVEASLENKKWDQQDSTSNGILASLDKDFVININIADDAAASKISKKVKGIVNSPSSHNLTNIYGDKIVSDLQNIEIRDFLTLLIESK